MGFIHITADCDNSTIICPTASRELRLFFSVNFGINPTDDLGVTSSSILYLTDTLSDLFDNRLTKKSVRKLRGFSERLFGCGFDHEKARKAFHTHFTLKDVSKEGILWLYRYTSYEYTSYEDSPTFHPYGDLLAALYCIYRGLSSFFAEHGRDVDTTFRISTSETSQQ